MRAPGKPIRRGFAAFAGSSGMIASTDDNTEALRFRYDIVPHVQDRQLRIDMHATGGADNRGPSLWQGIVDVHPQKIVMCFAREDKIKEHGRPKNCNDADSAIYLHATLSRNRLENVLGPSFAESHGETFPPPIDSSKLDSNRMPLLPPQ